MYWLVFYRKIKSIMTTAYVPWCKKMVVTVWPICAENWGEATDIQLRIRYDIIKSIYLKGKGRNIMQLDLLKHLIHNWDQKSVALTSRKKMNEYRTLVTTNKFSGVWFITLLTHLIWNWNEISVALSKGINTEPFNQQIAFLDLMQKMLKDALIAMMH